MLRLTLTWHRRSGPALNALSSLLSFHFFIALVVAFSRVEVPFHAPSESLFWDHPPGAPKHTCVSEGVLSALYSDYRMESVCPGVDLTDLSVDAWPEPALSVLLDANGEDLLAADGRGKGVRLGPSSIDGAGRGVFAERSSRRGERILSFFGTIVYDCLDTAALSNDWQMHQTVYGSGSFSTTALHWGGYSIELRTGCRFWRAEALATPTDFCPSMLRKKVNGKRKKRPLGECTRAVWIVPARYCLAGLVNDNRDVSKNVQKNGQRRRVPRASNVTMEQRWNPVITSRHVTLPCAIEMVATRAIRAGAEFFFDYGKEYALFG